MDIFREFPTEMREKLAGYLSVRDLLSCSMVSKAWRKGLNLDVIWRSHCIKKSFTPKTVEELDPEYYAGIDREDADGILEPLCRWRKIFLWHNRLKNNWIERNFKRHSLASEKCNSPVFCLHSDGKFVVSGHEDASVNVWTAEKKPRHVCKFFAALTSVPIVSVYLWERYIVILQRKLLQIYTKNGEGYEMKDAKTFELGNDKMSLIDKIKILGDSFDYWYKECLRLNDHGKFELRRLLFVVTEELLLTAVSGGSEMEVWTLDGKPRAILKGYHSIRCLQLFQKNVFTISDCFGDTHISRYSFSKRESVTVLRVPGWKRILFSDHYVLAVPNRMDTTFKMIWVWDRNYKLIRTRKLSFGHISAAPVDHLVVYTENSQVTVWDPLKDQVLKSFSAGMTVGFVKPVFSTILVMFMNASVHVWDFAEEKRLYRIYSELEWHGDFRDQLWLNPAMIIAGGVDKQMELLSFME